MNFTMNILPPSASNEPYGILLIDKPSGMTSHDVVYRLRRVLPGVRIGHAGTLDPLATGLLIMLIGRATKCSQTLTGLDKSYFGGMRFGIITDSYDSDGHIIENRPVDSMDIDHLQTIASSFIGESEQIPPMFSAKKFNGRPLYELARKGKNIDRLPVNIVIDRFVIENNQGGSADFFVHCSKGTYIRTLVHDFGQLLGCGAHLYWLRRSQIGPFEVSDALPLDQICSLSMPGICARLLDPDIRKFS